MSPTFRQPDAEEIAVLVRYAQLVTFWAEAVVNALNSGHAPAEFELWRQAATYSADDDLEGMMQITPRLLDVSEKLAMETGTPDPAAVFPGQLARRLAVMLDVAGAVGDAVAMGALPRA